MFGKSSYLLLLMTALLCLVQSAGTAANPSPTYTTILVKDMHCAACAKKIAAKLYKVAGVKEVRADVKKNKAFVVPEKEKSISPLAMWEAVESAGFHPTSLAGPAGHFTSKPKK